MQPYANTTALVSTVLLTCLQGTHGLTERSRKQHFCIGCWNGLGSPSLSVLKPAGFCFLSSLRFEILPSPTRLTGRTLVCYIFKVVNLGLGAQAFRVFRVCSQAFCSLLRPGPGFHAGLSLRPKLPDSFWHSSAFVQLWILRLFSCGFFVCGQT